MFTHIVPKFAKGRILKTAMLENLRDFPREYADIYYRDYADGIITGANIEVGEEALTVTPGIVKYKSRLYLLDQPAIVAYQATGRETVVKIRFREGTTDVDWSIYHSDIVIDEHIESQPSELELCRFKLKEGAKLRQDYQNFRDLVTEYNTVNLLHVRIAAYGQSTVSPFIMRYFGEELLRRGSSEAQDLAFAMMSLNEGILNRKVITHYIANRLGIPNKDYTNVEIHKHLARILESARGGGGRMGMSSGGSLRVIVD
ncbi:hypothetical protein D3C76_360840 [compost metagenome]